MSLSYRCPCSCLPESCPACVSTRGWSFGEEFIMATDDTQVRKTIRFAALAGDEYVVDWPDLAAHSRYLRPARPCIKDKTHIQ